MIQWKRWLGLVARSCLAWSLLAGTLPAQILQQPVRVGFLNDLPVPILIRDLTQPLAPPIRLGPKEMVWDRLPAGARIPVAVSDALSGQLLAKTVLMVPAKGSILYAIHVSPMGNVILTPQQAP
ncbi:MAG: hypothetical protein RMJ19_01645 [Gemmatales bacterium]|nr:hypothetical protein [Gemmatales bacterium]MDW8174349.1 hypothetical protein [Gemmatales bacterium]